MKAILLGLALMVCASVLGWAVTGLVATNSSDAYLSENNSVRLD